MHINIKYIHTYVYIYICIYIYTCVASVENGQTLKLLQAA